MIKRIEDSVVNTINAGTELILTKVNLKEPNLSDEYSLIEDLLFLEDGMINELEPVFIRIRLRQGEAIQDIGHISGYMFNEDLDIEGNISIFDEISAEMLSFAETILKEDVVPFANFGFVDETFFFMDNFFIDENFRNMGFGNKVLKSFEMLFEGKHSGVVLDACPYALSKAENFEKVQKRIVRTYRKHGYKLIYRSNNDRYLVKMSSGN